MDFRIGGTPPIQDPASRTNPAQEPIEARILAVREPRRRVDPQKSREGQRRRKPHERDPRGGRVLLLMIPEGHQLPPGLDKGSYRVFLRFVRR